MKTLAIIQARMGSSRLPGKVLKTLGGKSVLAHVIERVQQANIPVLVATSNLPQDEPIITEAKNCGAKFFAGDENNVLSRYYHAAKQEGAELIVRITSDCPLYDGKLLAQMLAAYNDEDYFSNALQRSFPRGLDTEIFKFSALEKAFNEATTQTQLEHVTPYINQNPQLFKIGHFVGTPDNSAMRWTLDTAEDWLMISAVYNALYKGKIFSTAEVLEFLEANPNIAAINAHIEQKKV